MSAITSDELMVAMLAGLGSAGSGLDPCANAARFVERYQLLLDAEDMAKGLQTTHKHLLDLYEDNHRFQVLQACAQSGKTGFLMAFLLRTAVGAAWGRSIGYYFPDKELPLKFSHTRLRPMARSNPAIAALIGQPRNDGSKGMDSVLSMTLGATSLFLMTIKGKTATEGQPLKAVFFDEVRRIDKGDIERAEQRYSAQVDPIDFKVSTPKYPKGTISEYFMQGDQRYFHTACRCPDGIVMPLEWPGCVMDLRGATPKLRRSVEHAYSHAGRPFLGMTEQQRAQYPAAAYHCPRCGTILVDPQDGYWQPHNPNAWVHSWQLGKMLSPLSPAGRMLDVFEKARDISEFHNSELGLAHVDKDKMPVQAEHIDACVDKDLVWGEHMTDAQRRRAIVNCGAGLDVQAGYGILVIKKRMPNGKHRVVHLEVVERPPNSAEDVTWWRRVSQLMRRYDIRLIVVDEAPEFTASHNFALQWPGRAYLANYGLPDNSPRIVSWEDRVLGDDDKQIGDNAFRYRVSISRTRALHWSVHRWKYRINEIPNLDTLMQSLPHQQGEPFFSNQLRIGTRAPAALGRILQDHSTRFVFKDVIEDDPANKEKLKLGQHRYVAEHVGSSPDFAHASLYADVALDRIGSASGFGTLSQAAP